MQQLTGHGTPVRDLSYILCLQEVGFLGAKSSWPLHRLVQAGRLPINVTEAIAGDTSTADRDARLMAPASESNRMTRT
jgi:hypothetical protein